jgi:hypothetical protein
MGKKYRDENLRFLKQSQWKTDQKDHEEASVEIEVEVEEDLAVAQEEISIAEDTKLILI